MEEREEVAQTSRDLRRELQDIHQSKKAKVIV